jgi:hypothetical protein
MMELSHGPPRQALTHPETLDILDTCPLYRPAREENAETGPNEDQTAEGDWDEPVKWKQLVGTAENRVEWWGVDEEHDQRASRKDPDEVVLVANYMFPERKTGFCLDSKDLCKVVGEWTSARRQESATHVEALGKENRQIHYTQQVIWDHSTTPISRTDRLSLSKCLDLLRSGKGLPLVVDEVGAILFEVA